MAGLPGSTPRLRTRMPTPGAGGGVAPDLVHQRADPDKPGGSPQAFATSRVAGLTRRATSFVVGGGCERIISDRNRRCQ